MSRLGASTIYSSERGGVAMKIQRILLVDDCTADAVIIQDAFKSEGYKGAWDIGHTVHEAREVMRGCTVAERPDLMLLDYLLPDGSGMELLRAANAHPLLRSVPMVVLTALSAGR